MFSLVLSINWMNAQNMGCTDSLASNFNEFAFVNDGSCMYEDTLIDIEFITFLSDTVDETSGLAYFNNQLLTHNDSGNENRIYIVDKENGSVTKTIVVKNATNVDWESMAENETHLFVGDFGNNAGNRQDLNILKIAKEDVLILDTVEASLIYFNYPDQLDFTPANNNNNFDCEAFFYKDDSLHLFSKNWVNQQTKYYTLPIDTGVYTANLKDTFNVNGLITGADINELDEIVLVGYNTIGAGFVWLLYDYPNNDFFKGNRRRLNLPHAINIGQIEGLVFSEEKNGFISAESFMNNSARLHQFDFSDFLKKDLETTNLLFLEEESIADFSKVSPNPSSGNFLIELSHSQCETTTYSFFDASGRMIEKGSFIGQNHTHKLNINKGGNFFLQLENCNKRQVHKLIVNID